jgi:hypothetical protein
MTPLLLLHTSCCLVKHLTLLSLSPPPPLLLLLLLHQAHQSLLDVLLDAAAAAAVAHERLGQPATGCGDRVPAVGSGKHWSLHRGAIPREQAVFMFIWLLLEALQFAAHDLLHCGIRRPHRLQTLNYSVATYFPCLKPFLTAICTTYCHKRP